MSTTSTNPLTPGVDDLFGAWEAPVHGLSFAAGDASTPVAPAWQPRLPASTTEAMALLAAQERDLARAEEHLAQAQARLEALASDVRALPTVAFAVPGPGAGAPEVELLGAVNRIRAMERDQAMVSFGWFGQEEPDDQQETVGQWQDLLQRARDILSNYALIDTAPGGAPVGRTAVSWGGDFDTTWESGATVEQMQLHQRNVRVALASRRALARLVMVVSTGAAGLAVRLSVPGAQLVLLPYVWKFVRDVLKELRLLRSS